MTKRTFFKSIMGAVAAVALAPEICFGVRLKMPGTRTLRVWWKNGNYMQATLSIPATYEEACRFETRCLEAVFGDDPIERMEFDPPYAWPESSN